MSSESWNVILPSNLCFFLGKVKITKCYHPKSTEIYKNGGELDDCKAESCPLRLEYRNSPLIRNLSTGELDRYDYYRKKLEVEK